MRSRLFCALALGGLTVALLAGCGADGASSDSASGSSAEGAPVPAAERVVSDPQADTARGGDGARTGDDAKGGAGSAGNAAVARLVRTADITVEVPDVARAAERIRTTAVALGGIVSTENTTSGRAVAEATDESAGSGDSGESGSGGPDDSGNSDESRGIPAPGSASRAGSVITVRVPEPKMDDALDRIAGAGRELDRSTSTEDVTATVADLDSRVQTQIRSVARVRDLLGRAKSLSDVVLLESELSKREADLESVQARLRALSDKAALATVTVTLVTPATSADREDDDDQGFLVGLGNGWDALKASTSVVLTVVGALIPIGVLVALIGLPAYLIRRRLRPAPTDPAPAGPAPTGPAPAPAEQAPEPESTPV